MTDIEHVLIWVSGAVCVFAITMLCRLSSKLQDLEKRYGRLIRAHNALHGHLRVEND